MRNILIIGVGRSSSSLVKYLIGKAHKEDLNIVLADLSLENAKAATLNSDHAEAIQLDIKDKDGKVVYHIVSDTSKLKEKNKVIRDC